MIKKTKTRYTKKSHLKTIKTRHIKTKHIKTKHIKKRHIKTRHIKKRHIKTRHIKTRRYKKRYSINKLNTLPGSQGVPVFSAPTINPEQTINPVNKIYIDSDHKESGNIIPGLRTYLGKN